MTSSIYSCGTCNQTFSKIPNGVMGKFKQHLNTHPSNRDFKKLLGVNLRELEK